MGKPMARTIRYEVEVDVDTCVSTARLVWHYKLQGSEPGPAWEAVQSRGSAASALDRLEDTVRDAAKQADIQMSPQEAIAEHRRGETIPLEEIEKKYGLADTRSQEKQQSRDEDARRLASGEVTRDELRRENGHFAFPEAEIDLKSAKPLK